jgi:hypothetical protein
MFSREQARLRWQEKSSWKDYESIEAKENALLLIGKRFRNYKHNIYAL